MNKAELAERLIQKTGLAKKQIEHVLESWEEEVTNALREGKEVVLTGFGTFSSRVRLARMGVNPRNPSERIQMPEVKVPKFKAGKALKDALKGK